MKSKTVKIPSGRLEIEYGLRQIDKPYFSITATKYKGRWPKSCGMLHDDIMKYSPEFKDLIEVHLRDENGYPMHSLENGLFFYESAKNCSNDPDSFACQMIGILAKHLMIDNNECFELIQEMNNGNSRDILESKIKELAPKWKAKSDEIIVKYNLK